MQVVENTVVRNGFARMTVIVSLLVFVVGAIFIGYSQAIHPAAPSHVDVLNTTHPMNVLVGVQGTPLQPGFVGFVAVVKPHSRVLNVVPLSGMTPVTTAQGPEPLYQAISDTTSLNAMHLVSKASGMPIDHYFYVTGSDLSLVLNDLYYHTPNWPKADQPLTMFQTLGYPYGRTNPKEEMALLSKILNGLPLVSPLAASKLLAIPNNASTNLTTEQLFLLANYVRGDKLVETSASRYAHTRRTHG